MEMILKVVMAVMLLLFAIQDIYKKKLLLWPMILGALIVIVCSYFSGSLTIINRLGGLSIGLVVILISLLTSGKIGLGDGILLSITGIGIGLWANFELFAIALFLSAIVSIFLLIFRLANRKKSIPFVPFLFISYLFLIVVSIKNKTP